MAGDREIRADERRGHFTCGRSPAGQTYCWGFNDVGQLGDNTTTTRRVPVAVQQGGNAYVQISTGFSHVCGLTAGGQAWCWGSNVIGQLGDNTTTNRSTPVAVQQGGNSYVEIAAGSYHTCGRTATGRVYCWGLNALGQLGDQHQSPCAGGGAAGSVSVGRQPVTCHAA